MMSVSTVTVPVTPWSDLFHLHYSNLITITITAFIILRTTVYCSICANPCWGAVTMETITNQSEHVKINLRCGQSCCFRELISTFWPFRIQISRPWSNVCKDLAKCFLVSSVSSPLSEPDDGVRCSAHGRTWAVMWLNVIARRVNRSTWTHWAQSRPLNELQKPLCVCVENPAWYNDLWTSAFWLFVFPAWCHLIQTAAVRPFRTAHSFSPSLAPGFLIKKLSFSSGLRFS